MGEHGARILVVANQTADSDQLLDVLRERASGGPTRFTLLVPVTHRGAATAAADWPDVAAAADEAEADERMSRALERFRSFGLDVEGRLGVPDALAAVREETGRQRYDQIIVSTLPLHVSKWLKLDLPHRVERATGLPVIHVTASEQKLAA